MGLLTKKYNVWAKHPEKYTAKQVLEQIVADLKWLDEEEAKKCNIQRVSKRYSEKDMLNAAKYGYEYRDTTSFPEMDFDSNCKNNVKQWLTTVK